MPRPPQAPPPGEQQPGEQQQSAAPTPENSSPRPRRHPCAVLALVVALAGAALSPLPSLGMAAWVLCPLGLVLSLVVANSPERPGRLLAAAATALALVGLSVCALGLSGVPIGASPHASVPAAAPSTSFRPGSYAVGREITAGRYATVGAPGTERFTLCSATRLDATGGARAFPETSVGGPLTLTVAPTDSTVTFSGPCTWARVR